ncbi:reverse transcriptase domain-containing protein [Tanacetum coccineum]
MKQKSSIRTKKQSTSTPESCLRTNSRHQLLPSLPLYSSKQPMWAADRVVAPTLGSAITIPETANEFAIKGNHLTLIKGNQFDGRTKTDPHKHIYEFLRICDMFKYRDTENEAVRLMMFPLSLTREAKTWLDELNEGTIKTWDELRTAFISRFFPPALFDRLLGEIRAFSQHENESLTDAWLRMKEMLRNCHGHNLSKGNIIKIFYHGLNDITKEVLNAAPMFSNSDTDKIMARMDAMTMKMEARYIEFQSRSKQTNLDDDDIPMSREEEAKFMQTFCHTHFYNDYRDHDSNCNNWRSSGRNDYNRDNYQFHYDDKPDLKKQLSDFIKAQHSTNSFVKNTFMDLKNKLEITTKNHQASIPNLEAKFDRLADKQSGRPFGSLPSNTQPNPKVNPNDQNDYETPINFDSDDEDDELTPQPKPKTPKPVKETSIPKPYKPKIPYPQHLRKEKMEAQYEKFLDMIRAVRINIPLVDVFAGMPNYGKFLKELVNNKHKIEQILAAFLSDESSAILQNKVPPKLGDPKSFLIPCNFNKAFSCNALADLGASINLMPYSLYQLNLGVGTERMIFHIDSAMKHSYSNDDTCFTIDVIDEILEEDFDALLNEGSKILHSIEGTILEEKLFAEFDEFMAMTADENFESESDTEEPLFKKITFNTDYKIKTSLKEPPTDLELKPLPDNMEYVFLEEPPFLPVIISSQLSEENKNKLIFVIKKHKQAFSWKTTDILGICPSFCKYKI